VDVDAASVSRLFAAAGPACAHCANKQTSSGCAPAIASCSPLLLNRCCADAKPGANRCKPCCRGQVLAALTRASSDNVSSAPVYDYRLAGQARASALRH
jgi:hypothetical protein